MSNDKISINEEKRTNSCPACGKISIVKGSVSIVSPWVLELSEIQVQKCPQYKICEFCQSGWFNEDYSHRIMDSLYKAYRGKKYFEIRNSWEPTYTDNLNSNLNNGKEWLAGRRLQIIKSLEIAGLKPAEMESVLDFGGGHGGVMPEFPKRYLLEANEAVIPEIGVTLIKSLDDASEISLNLVMCCGVLEHLNDPQALIENITQLNSEIFLFEVPTGIPIRRVGLSASKKFLQLVASRKKLWSAIQIIERRVGRKWRKYFPLRCSEHLQFFSDLGLQKLLERSGLEVLGISETKPNASLADEKNLGFEAGLIAICRKPPKD